MEEPLVNDICSICHGSFNTPCQANCSHWFCGTIIVPLSFPLINVSHSVALFSFGCWENNDEEKRGYERKLLPTKFKRLTLLGLIKYLLGCHWIFVR